MSEFLAMIEYSARKQGVYSLNETDVMDKLTIKSTEVLCKKKSYKNGSENGTAAYSYSLLKNGDQFRSLILNTCNEIFYSELLFLRQTSNRFNFRNTSF